MNLVVLEHGPERGSGYNSDTSSANNITLTSTKKKGNRRKSRKKTTLPNSDLGSASINQAAASECVVKSTADDPEDLNLGPFSIKPVPRSEINGSAIRVKDVTNPPVKLRHTIFRINFGQNASPHCVLPSYVPNGIVQPVHVAMQNLTDVPLQQPPKLPLVAKIAQQQIPARKEKDEFPSYLSVEEVKRGLLCGELIEGVLRINLKNYREAYIRHKEQLENDYLILGMRARNKALEGDVVVIQLNSESDWRPEHKTATVVYIKEAVSFLIPYLLTRTFIT